MKESIAQASPTSPLSCLLLLNLFYLSTLTVVDRLNHTKIPSSLHFSLESKKKTLLSLVSSLILFCASTRSTKDVKAWIWESFVLWIYHFTSHRSECPKKSMIRTRAAAIFLSLCQRNEPIHGLQSVFIVQPPRFMIHRAVSLLCLNMNQSRRVALKFFVITAWYFNT